MNTRENTRAIAEVAASQMGLFTSAQVARFNVSRNVLAYMAKTGKIERLEHGVYRVSGMPYDVNQGIYAAWLSTNPAQMAYERLSCFDGIIVGGRSAAAIHGIGDFFLAPYRFLTRERFNSKRQGIIFTKRFVNEVDVVFIDSGLPVTSIARTIFDLQYDNEEPSLLAGVLSDAMRSARSFDVDRLMALFKEKPISRRNFSETDLEKLMAFCEGIADGL
jgi:predicted transcriptional regulator of viral defense system